MKKTKGVDKEWTKEKLWINFKDWEHVMWSDESHFQLYHVDGRRGFGRDNTKA